MGGNALIIDGDLDVARLTRPGFLGRLLGGKSAASSNGDADLHEIPAERLRVAGEEFERYLKGRLAPAWPSTSAIMKYLPLGLRLYLRRDRHADPPSAWYLQITFGDCAGMAQTSSDVAAHWASVWYQQEGERIAQLLDERGFSPSALRAADDEPVTFIPIGGLGYASFRPSDSGEAGNGAGAFDIDNSAREALAEDADALLDALAMSFRDTMADGRCRCQMCDPAFERESLRGLPGIT